MFPASQYIDDVDGALRIAGTRVSLNSIIAGFKGGECPEKIVESFPTVSLAQAYGAIAYYLDNKELIEEYFARVEREFNEMVPPLSQSDPKLFARLEEARRQMAAKRT